VDTKARNQIAIASLIFAKVLGIAGLIVGAMGHRILGGSLLACDGVLLIVAVVIGLRSVKAAKSDESDQKQLLAQMMREGTLDQYLRDLRTEKQAQ
jgi:hypothetical protein